MKFGLSVDGISDTSFRVMENVETPYLASFPYARVIKQVLTWGTRRLIASNFGILKVCHRIRRDCRVSTIRFLTLTSYLLPLTSYLLISISSLRSIEFICYFRLRNLTVIYFKTPNMHLIWKSGICSPQSYTTCTGIESQISRVSTSIYL